MGVREDGRKRKYLAAFFVIWALQMAAAFGFCVQKQGFHEDEYYTYYSTARTNGFYVEDGKWMERDAYRNEFVVLEGQRFQYGLVKQVQSWDVHPPMYYWVFHTVASLVPGVFSKWIGLSVNLFFHGLNLILLTYLSYLLSGKKAYLPFLTLCLYGFSPAAMSGVVFIRMYEMLTTFVLLCAILHVRVMLRTDWDMGRGRPLSAGVLLAMAAVTYAGFLTQYYYFIFLFFMAVGFCLWLLWRERKIGSCLRYGLAQGAAFVLAYLTYPAFPGQMFKGQRGGQAVGNFFELSNTFSRLGFFWDLMNRYVFGGLLGAALVLLLLAAALVLWKYYSANKHLGKDANSNAWSSGENVLLSGSGKEESGRKKLRLQNDVGAENGCKAQKDSRRSENGCVDVGTRGAFYVLLFTAAGYFIAVSKTALLLGGTSVRYQLPIYGIVVILLFSGAQRLCCRLAEMLNVTGGQDGSGSKTGHLLAENGKCFKAVAAVFCLAALVMSYRIAGVEFLYPEDREQTEHAKNRAKEQAAVIYFYKPGEEWCIWDVTDELLAYPAVCFVSADSEEPIADEKIENADSLVVYLAKGADVRGQLERLAKKDGVPVQNGLQLVFEEKYCDVYDMSR